jgi:hypothetical protein
MLEKAIALMTKENGETPCQYIVTTKTEPSEALRSVNVTKETLSSGPGSLFKMQLENDSPDSPQRSLPFDEGSDA